jgi:DNA gyrase/topoisomerase IV subunit B
MNRSNASNGKTAATGVPKNAPVLTEDEAKAIDAKYVSLTAEQHVVERPNVMLGSNVSEEHTTLVVERVLKQEPQAGRAGVGVKKETLDATAAEDENTTEQEEEEKEDEAEDEDEEETNVKNDENKQEKGEYAPPPLESALAPEQTTKSAQANGAQAKGAQAKAKARKAEWRLVPIKVEYPPAVLTPFEEPINNIYDHSKRAGSGCTSADITYDRKTGVVTYRNNGQPPECVFSASKNKWIPEALFFNMHSGSNFGTEQRLGGGQNGVGIVLCSCVAKRVELEIGDPHPSRQLLYRQTSRDHLTTLDAPVVKPYRKKMGYVQFRFEPDYDLFRKWGMTDSFLDFLDRRLRTRCFELAMGGMKVTYNGEKVPIRNWKDYCAMLPAEQLVVQELKPAFRVAVGLVPSTALRDEEGHPLPSVRQRSFVNGILTQKGGTHVALIESKLVEEIMRTDKEGKAEAKAKEKEKAKAKTKDKNKGTSDKAKAKAPPKLTRKMILQHLFVAVDCTVPNPAFESQSKQLLTTKVADWGAFKPEFPDSFVKRVLKRTNVAELARMERDEKAQRQMDRIVGAAGSSRSYVNIPKLRDAPLAGTRRWREAMLFVVEGQSACGTVKTSEPAFPVPGGLGTFELKGKPLSLAGTTLVQRMRNAEYCNLMKALGLRKEVSLEPGAAHHPRYGRVVFFTDADPDGDHIRALLLQMFREYKPLFDRGFVHLMLSPVVRARKGTKEDAEVKSFYTEAEYNAWRNALPERERAAWRSKHYKGLGTMNTQEGMQLFRELSSHLRRFAHTGPACDEAIDFAFNKKRVLDRRALLGEKSAADFRELSILRSITVREFVREQLPVYWIYSNERAIPHVLDGMKPSQRKVLDTVKKQKWGSAAKEVKVTSLTGATIERAMYVHGEKSLQDAIVIMAAQYSCAANVPLLAANGQYGTRSRQGADAAAARYLNTFERPMSHALFRAEDGPLLTPVVVEGNAAEPVTFYPVLPYVLLNGASGIGTGWATEFCGVDPEKLCDYVSAAADGNSSSPPPAPSAAPVAVQAPAEASKKESSVKAKKGKNAKGAPAPDAEENGEAEREADAEDKDRDGDAEVDLELLEEAVDDVNHLETDVLSPYIRGFRGTIAPTRRRGVWLARGVAVYRPENRTIAISEIPPYVKFDAWRQSTFDKHMEEKLITPDSVFVSGADAASAVLDLTPDGLARWVQEKDGTHTLTPVFWKEWRLVEALQTNIVLFTPRGTIQRYRSYREVLDEWIPIRRAQYVARGRYWHAQSERQCRRLANQVRFLQCLLSGEIAIRTPARPKREWVALLERMKFERLSEAEADDEADDEEKGDAEGERREEPVAGSTAGYDYLIQMRFSSVTLERKQQLEAQLRKQQAEVARWAEVIRDPTAMWRAEIEEFRAAWRAFLVECKKNATGQTSKPGSKTGSRSKSGAKRARKPRVASCKDE